MTNTLIDIPKTYVATLLFTTGCVNNIIRKNDANIKDMAQTVPLQYIFIDIININRHFIKSMLKLLSSSVQHPSKRRKTTHKTVKKPERKPGSILDGDFILKNASDDVPFFLWVHMVCRVMFESFTEKNDAYWALYDFLFADWSVYTRKQRLQSREDLANFMTVTNGGSLLDQEAYRQNIMRGPELGSNYDVDIMWGSFRFRLEKQPFKSTTFSIQKTLQEAWDISRRIDQQKIVGRWLNIMINTKMLM